MPPAGLAKFDSAAAMLQALARFHHGDDFRGLGQSALLRRIVRLADWVPRYPRERVFARLGAQEGIKPEAIDQVDTAAIADWAASLYPERRYPAVLIGSASGALVHLAAAFGIPWLPQTFLTLMDQRHVHPDDGVGAMEAGRAAGQRFLAANPDVQLHQLHDPAQDRLMLDHITYFRFKFRRLPAAYRRFLARSLAPGGSIIIADCRQRWPVTRLDERHVFQFGALGGPTREEYLHGGERVTDYLRRYDSPFSSWHSPPVNDEAPEAEWGFEPALAEDIAAFANANEYHVGYLPFDDPERLSPPVAELYRQWNGERGVAENRLVIESFILLDPQWVLRTGSVPYWMTFNMEDSLHAVERYLASTSEYDRLHLMLFAHGMDSVGLPPIEAWQQLLNQGRQGGSFLGINPRTYPAHFSTFGKYSETLQALPRHYPLPAPLPIERLNDFLAKGKWH